MRMLTRNLTRFTFAAIFICSLSSNFAMADSESAREFAAQALALRSAGAIGEKPAQAFLEAMPGSGLAGEVPLTVLWSPFFENAIVKLGRLNSPGPVALYYNPLLDIAVLAYWQKQEDGYRISTIRAAPGEKMSDSDAPSRLLPSWMRAVEDPVGELAATTGERLELFSSVHPSSFQDAGRNSTTFAAAAKDMRLVLSRLYLNAEMRASWTENEKPWLNRTLEDVENALTVRDMNHLMSAAPDTDPETAAALGNLPAEFVETLTLDATLDAGSTRQLLIGSSPMDGDIYVLVLCRMENAEYCELRGFEVLSLVE